MTQEEIDKDPISKLFQLIQQHIENLNKRVSDIEATELRIAEAMNKLADVVMELKKTNNNQ